MLSRACARRITNVGRGRSALPGLRASSMLLLESPVPAYRAGGTYSLVVLLNLLPHSATKISLHFLEAHLVLIVSASQPPARSGEWSLRHPQMCDRRNLGRGFECWGCFGRTSCGLLLCFIGRRATPVDGLFSCFVTLMMDVMVSKWHSLLLLLFS
jgi:hypothetical protein